MEFSNFSNLICALSASAFSFGRFLLLSWFTPFTLSKIFRFLQAQITERLLFSCRPLLYGILAHFLQGGHSDGRRLRGLKDESLLRPVSRDIHSRGNPEGLLHVQDRGDGGRLDSSFGHEPEPVVVRGGRR